MNKIEKEYTVLEKIDYNSNNAWGFGGVYGKLHFVFSNEFRKLAILKGDAYYRHLPSVPVTIYRVFKLSSKDKQVIASRDVSKMVFDRYFQLLKSHTTKG